MNLWLRRQTRYLLSVGLVVAFVLGLAAATKASRRIYLKQNDQRLLSEHFSCKWRHTKGGSNPAPLASVGTSKAVTSFPRGGTRPTSAPARGAGRIRDVSKGGKASNSGDTGRIGEFSKGGKASVSNSGAMDNAASAITDSNLGNVAGNAGGAGSARNAGAKSKGDSVPKVSTGNAQATTAGAPATRNTKQGASAPARQPAATITDPNMPVDFGGCPGCSKGGDDLRVR